MNYERVA